MRFQFQFLCRQRKFVLLNSPFSPQFFSLSPTPSAGAWLCLFHPRLPFGCRVLHTFLTLCTDGYGLLQLPKGFRAMTCAYVPTAFHAWIFMWTTVWIVWYIARTYRKYAHTYVGVDASSATIPCYDIYGFKRICLYTIGLLLVCTIKGYCHFPPTSVSAFFCYLAL